MKNKKKGKVAARQKIASPSCPKCGGRETIRSGQVQGEQRWKCKSCAYQFTRLTRRGRPIWQKSLVVFLYSYGVSMHAIGRIFHVQPSTVLKWVRAYTREYQLTPPSGSIFMMEMKEFQRRLKAAGQDSRLLCIAIDDDTFKKSLGISITRDER